MEELANLNILVTGGAGFIGSNLCEYLLRNGSMVTCLDNCSTGYAKNIKSFQNNPNFTIIEGDIRDLDTCQRACAGQDYVLHQAASVSVPRSINDPLLCNSVNVEGFLNMIIAASDQKVKRFIFATSSSVYGDSIELPKVESKIGKPLSPYALSKLSNELYAQIFSEQYGLEYVGLRYFNVFGPKQDPESPYSAVIPLFVKKFLNHESPLINGDGSFSRDFTHIDNVIEMNKLAILTNNPEAVNQIYNVACGQNISLNKLVCLIKDELLIVDDQISEIDITYGPERNGDIPHSIASIEKAQRLLNFTPVKTPIDGLQSTINWYCQEHSNKIPSEILK